MYIYMHMYPYISRGPGKSSKDSENSFNSGTSDYKRNKFGNFLRMYMYMYMYITQLILLYIFHSLSLSLLPPSLPPLPNLYIMYVYSSW